MCTTPEHTPGREPAPSLRIAVTDGELTALAGSTRMVCPLGTHDQHLALPGFAVVARFMRDRQAACTCTATEAAELGLAAPGHTLADTEWQRRFVAIIDVFATAVVPGAALTGGMMSRLHARVIEADGVQRSELAMGRSLCSWVRVPGARVYITVTHLCGGAR